MHAERTDKNYEAVERERAFDDACEALADLILNAIEGTFESTNGTRLHPDKSTESDLIAVLNRAKTDA